MTPLIAFLLAACLPCVLAAQIPTEGVAAQSIAAAQDSEAANEHMALEFGDMDLAQLMDVEVISVSRTPRSIGHSPAAIFVITREDIQRSGHLSLPELLRGVPGLHVARINNDQYSIASRGFGGRFSDKLQVMIDGRIIYNSLFSGVVWGDQELLLSDVERIEIVRGPGGAQWGSNAVNGVINIITRSAAEDHSDYYSILGGTHERGQVELRQGGQLDASGDAWWRAHAKWTDTLPSPGRPGFGETDFHDYARSGLVGFRMDWVLNESDSLMLQGNYAHIRNDQDLTFLDLNVFGAKRLKSAGESNNASLLARWDHRSSSSTGSSLLGYLDAVTYNSIAYDNNERRASLEYYNYSAPWDEHVVTWGLGYIFSETSLDGGERIFDTTQGLRNHILTGFIQDEWQLNDAWSMIVGSRLEQRRLGDFTVQPNARLLWSPKGSKRSLWAGVSRALRAPSYKEVNLALPAGLVPGTPPTLFTFVGGEDVKAEQLTAIELGYREQFGSDFSLDLTAYYFDYERLYSFEPLVPPVSTGPLDLVDLVATNNAGGHSTGLEFAAEYAASADWDLQVSGSWINIDVSTGAGSTINENKQSNLTPKYLGALHSKHDLSDSVQLDLALYVTGAYGGIPSYLRGDLRLGWRLDSHWDLSLGLQNAFQPRHTEALPGFLTTVADVERSAFVRLAWSP